MKELTLNISWMRSGALVRNQVRHVFSEVERNGGTARYYEDKRLLESIFTDIKLTGPEATIKWAAETLDMMISVGNWEED